MLISTAIQLVKLTVEEALLLGRHSLVRHLLVPQVTNGMDSPIALLLFRVIQMA